ncbi:TFIID and SAGA complexes subunit [Talaromyces pinophilus]|uniref:TFIID and SAGA complexes subunit n=1 Tax=Talaromyces pinophilus TaxID=128442 RepID=A0A6V8H034_TALPI|nr:TFIID and SAGA complexes subunit [Talaromyces pinophilus]
MADSTTTSQQSVAGSQLPPPSTQPLTQSTEAPTSSAETVTASNTLQPGGDSNLTAGSANRDIDLGGADPIDDAIDNDINMNHAEDMPAANGTNDAGAPANPAALASASAPASKKESSLRDFLGKMDDYAPIIPDAVTAHYLTVAGLPPPGNGPNQTPPHLARLLALATQKFVADIAADSYQYSRIRASNSSSANNPMGGLNAAAGLGGPAAAGGGAGAGGTGGVGGDAGKKSGAANTHLGIQRPGFGGGGQGGSGQGRTVLTMEDLGMAVSEYGVSVKRGEFYR